MPFRFVNLALLFQAKCHLSDIIDIFYKILAKIFDKYIKMPYFCLQIVTKQLKTMEKIDKLDKQIMEIISANARIPFKDVAAVCGVSRAAIHQRVQRLIDTNVIIGSGYNINPKSLGYNTCTYVGIRLEKGSMYAGVVEELNKIPEIVECHYTTGPYTMLVKLYARDNEQLMDLLNRKIQGIHGVDSTETLISLDQSIKKEVPICITEISEDKPKVFGGEAKIILDEDE